MTTSLLTSSALSSMRRCQRQYWLCYELALRRAREAAPLRMGSAFHKGLELAAEGRTQFEIMQAATEPYYGPPPGAMSAEDWELECQIVRCLLAGHFWRYDEEPLEFLATEQSFEIPLVNPATGRSSRTFRLAGKIDGIVRLPDGRLLVIAAVIVRAWRDDQGGTPQ
jgi:hypothetical protein